MHHFHTKLPYQKPMLRQIEWGVQNGPITNNRLLPVAALFFWKFCFDVQTYYKLVNLMYQLPKCPDLYFLEPPEVFWLCYFPVNILNVLKIVTLFSVIDAYFRLWMFLPTNEKGHFKWSQLKQTHIHDHFYIDPKFPKSQI